MNSSKMIHVYKVSLLAACFLLLYGFAAYCLINTYNPRNYPPLTTLVGVMLIFFALSPGVYAAAVHIDPARKARYRDICMVTAFIFYMLMAAYILFLDRRRAKFLDIVPFSALTMFIRSLIDDRLSLQFVLLQLGLHFYIYAPLGFFLPRLFPALRRTRNFCLFLLAFFPFISLLMFALRCGSIVFDLLLFSYFGAMAAFWIDRRWASRVASGLHTKQFGMRPDNTAQVP